MSRQDHEAIEDVLDEVFNERLAQDAKWGEQNHPDGTAQHGDKLLADEGKFLCDLMTRRGRLTWRHILHEEVLEAFAEVDPERLRKELLQVAAVATAWVQAIDRRPLK